jgi:ArsR family transcriptional regulator
MGGGLAMDSQYNTDDSLNEEVIYDIADFFKVFGDSTRIRILYTLIDHEMCVSELVQKLNMNQSAISHQLRVLRQNDLVKFRKDGKTVYYSLDDSHVTVLLQQGLEHILHKKVYE